MRLVKIVTCCRCGQTFPISADKIPSDATRRNKILADCILCGESKVKLTDEMLYEVEAE